MDFGPLVSDVYKYYGIVGLLAVCACALAGTCIAQMLTLNRFSSSVAGIVAQQLKIIDNQDRAHDLCQVHAGIVREQIEGMRALSFELRAVVDNLHKYHMDTSIKLVELFNIRRATD